MKTAVEWLEEMFNNSEIPNSSMLFKQAKEMEKEQIIDAYYQGDADSDNIHVDADEYYNETFKSQEDDKV
jgi:hypothetical protein